MRTVSEVLVIYPLRGVYGRSVRLDSPGRLTWAELGAERLVATLRTSCPSRRLQRLKQGHAAPGLLLPLNQVMGDAEQVTLARQS